MKLFNIIRFKATPEEVTAEDVKHRKEFVLSHFCPSIEKYLRNRISKRNSDLVYTVKNGMVAQAAVFAAQMEELNDILLEWKNIRDDVRNASK